ncbi:acid protease [Suillus decipiens]|nr:acid protease [Suillus decipiens]
MFFAACLLTLLTLSITGSPVEIRNSRITLPMTRRPKVSNSTNLVQRDEARVAAFMDYSTHDRRTHIPATNHHTRYTVSVGIGDPATVYNLIVDTGSANTWVGAATPYVATGTSTNLRQPVGQTYGSASFEGIEFLDYVTVGPGLTVVLQSIGVASEVRGISDSDGVLGIGPVATTLGSLKDMPTEPVPTVTNSLYGQGTISREILGIFFQPYRGSVAATGGQITFGGTDPAMHDSNIAYTPITNSMRSRKYWGINQSITYGPGEILGLTAGILDCGTTFILIATDAYVRYRFATGARYDRATELLTISEDQFGDLYYLNFHINGETYSFTPDAQIWPRSLNTVIGGHQGSIYLIICDIGTRSGSGLDFHNGYVFMQRFYTVLDTTMSRVGFATTAFTYAATNYNVNA